MISSSFDWCNNGISALMAEYYPHDFSIMDGDGIVRKNYTSASVDVTRLIIYESKHENEHMGSQQLNTLTLLSKLIKWEECDEMSGVFIIRHDEGLNTFDISNVKTKINFKITSRDALYRWFSPLNISAAIFNPTEFKLLRDLFNIQKNENK
jgi:hypothetical protein